MTLAVAHRASSPFTGVLLFAERSDAAVAGSIVVRRAFAAAPLPYVLALLISDEAFEASRSNGS